MSSANFLLSGDSAHLLAKLREQLLLPHSCAGPSAPEIASTRFVATGDAILLLRPALLLADERDLLTELLLRLAEKNFLRSAHYLDEGLAVTLARVALASDLGCRVDLNREAIEAGEAESSRETVLFARRQAQALVTCVSSAHLALANFVERSGPFCGDAIGRVTGSGFTIRCDDAEVLSTTLESLRA